MCSVYRSRAVPGTIWLLTESSDLVYMVMFWEKGHMCIKTDILVFSEVSHKEESTTPKAYRNVRCVYKYILGKREEMRIFTVFHIQI